MSRKTKIIFSFLILVIGALILFSEYFNSKKIMVYDYMNELYYNEPINEEVLSLVDNIENEEDIVEEKKENNEEEANNTSYSFSNNVDNSIYIGYLSIPDINLKKGFTKKESKYNTVSKNIQILASSDYPDQENGNVILAAHSGNSSVSYFNKLYLLNIGSNLYIEYNNIKYTYEISNIYTVLKTGNVEVKRDKNKSTLTLITCTKNDNSTQTVYIADLINKE